MLMLNDINCSSEDLFINDDDLRNLEEYAEKLHNLGGFNLGSVSGNLVKKLHYTYTKEVQSMKNCFFLELLNKKAEWIFDIPLTASEVYKNLNLPPKKALSKYPASFIQNLAFQIRTVYDKPREFAQAVSSYLRSDGIQQLLFTSSTFPALYSYFLGKEFCESASLFIIALMVDSKRVLFSKALLSSFLHAVPTFYTRLWSLMANEMSNFGLSPSFDRLYTTLVECLEKSLCHLSVYHINAFASFAQMYPDEAISFLVDYAIGKEFALAADASPYLPYKKYNDDYIKFFQLLKKAENKKKAMNIVNMIRTHKEFLDIPSMGGPVWTRGIPILLSDSDIQILTGIMESSKLFKLIAMQDVILHNGTDTVFVNVFPSYVNKEHEDVCKALFGDKPPDLTVIDNELYSKYWRSIKIKSKQEYQDEFTFLNDPMNLKKYGILRKKEFRVYCFTKIIQIYNMNYNQLEKNVLIVEQESYLRDLKNSANCYLHTLFNKYCGPFLKKSIFKEKGSITEKIYKSISNIILDNENTNKMYYDLLCSALDQANITISNFPEGKKFLSSLNSWTENVWPQSSNRFSTGGRMVQILNAATEISHIGDLKFGKRLTVLFDFIRSLSQIVGNYIDSDWFSLMHIVMMTANTEDILTTFLFFYHIVFTDTSFIKSLGNNFNYLWDLFNVGMWDIIKADQNLYLACIDEKRMQNIFKISTTLLSLL